MIWPCRGLSLFSWALPFLLILVLLNSSGAQGLQTSPYSAVNEVRRGLSRGGLDFIPPNALRLPGSISGLPGRPDSLYISDQLFQGILPPIPNLEFGYLYYFGSNVSSGRLTADYILPIRLLGIGTVFGEAHAEFDNFWNTVTGGSSRFNNRVDVSLGGGYRRMLCNNTLVGVNGFYDTSRLGVSGIHQGV